MKDDSPETRLRCPVCLAVFRTEFSCCPVDGAALGPLTKNDDDPLIGVEIAGRYVFDALVGQGSMGQIYRAHHVRLPRTFAVKVLFGDMVADTRMRLRFAQEAALASRLSHPNVVPVVDFGRSERGLLYLVMDFVEGESLSELMARESPLDPLRVCRLARQLAEGLGHAHEHGLVHRDFKPGNVVLERHDDGPPVPRILDFGLAISTRERDEGPGRLTEFGFIVGTPMYIAPEQALDRAVDHRADLFALGVVMYEMLAGKPPFDGKPVEIAHKNVSQPPPPFAERSPEVAVTPELERVVRRLLAKSPDDRFESAAALCEALAEVERRAGERDTYAAGLGAVDWSESHDEVRPAGPFGRFFGIGGDDGDGDFALDMASGPGQALLLPQNRGRRLAAACAVAITGAALVYGLAARAGSSGEPRLEPQPRVAAAAEARVAPQPHVTSLPSGGAEAGARAPSAETAAPIVRPAAPPVPPAANGAGGANAANAANAVQSSAETPVVTADAPPTAGEGEAQAQARAAARKARAQRRVADLEAEDGDDAYDEESGEWPAEPDSPGLSQGQAAAASTAPADKSGPIEPPEMSEAPETEPASPPPTTTAAGAAPAPPDSSGKDLTTGQPAAPSTRQPPSAPPRRAPATRVQARPPNSAAPARPVDQNVSTQQLIHDYREVGQAIAALEVRKGDIAARYFRDRYFRVPYSDALRIPSVRRDALVALAALRRELTRAMGGD